MAIRPLFAGYIFVYNKRERRNNIKMEFLRYIYHALLKGTAKERKNCCSKYERKML